MTRTRAWWDAPVSTRAAYATAAVLGLLAFLVVYGPGHVLGTSAYWDMPQEDSRAYLMAYRYFLHEPWHWPLFTSYTINLPDAKSLALSDGLPLWALINKAIATVLPPWGVLTERAYLGLWHALGHVLQPLLGVAILRVLGHRTRGAAVITTVFFLALPSWIFRYQHAALSAHFLVLWPIYLYLRTAPREPPPRRIQIAWLCELTIAAMTNPYHVVMSFGVFVAAAIRSRTLRALAWLPAGLGVIGVAAGLTGYLSRATATPMGGFEIYTTNMMSMFVPPNSGIVGDARGWFGNEIPIHNQYEGLTYLGLGLIALFALFLPHARSLRRVIARHPALFTIALGVWCVALSTHIYFNSHEVLSYELPAKLSFVKTWFRAPGRFAYVPMYVLIVFLLQWGMTQFTRGWRRLVLPGLALLQLVDATGQWRIQHAYTREPFAHVLPIEPWRRLVHAHTTILELPTFDCLSDDWTKLKPALEIAYYASELAIPINGVYGARPVRDCTADERRFPVTPTSGTLYLWFAKSDRHARRFVAHGAACGHFDFGWACSTNHTEINAALQAGALQLMTPTIATLPDLAYGQPIRFGIAGTSEYLAEGWSYPESNGRWSEGPVSTLQLHMTGEPPSHVVMTLNAASVMCGKRKAQDVEVVINDTPVGTLHFDPGANDIEAVRTIQIPDPRLLSGPEVLVELRPSDVRPPNQVRCNDDARRTGVWLRQLSFEGLP